MPNGGAAQGEQTHLLGAPELEQLQDRVCLWCQERVGVRPYMLALGIPTAPDDIYVLHVGCDADMRRAIAQRLAEPITRYPQ